MPALNELKNEHYAERVIWKNAEFLDTVEAAMRSVAFDIHQEPEETWGHEQRKQIALNIVMSDVGSDTEAKRFRNIFATVILQHPQLRAQVFDTAVTTTLPVGAPLEQRVKPWLMDEATLQNVIRSAWNAAANVSPEPVAASPPIAPDESQDPGA